MSRKVITKEHEDYAKENYLKIPASDIDLKFGVSRGCTSRIYKKFGITVSRETILKFRYQKNVGRTSFSKEEDQFIKSNYLKMPVKTLASKINRSGVGVIGRLKAMNLTIPKEIIEQRKRDSYIKKGHIPLNKGKKQVEYMSAEAIEKTKVTRFQKGQNPHNTKYDGHERIDKDGYVLIRVKVGKYVLKHRLLWEENYGKIPKKMAIVFKNGDKTDIRIENLECISLEENMRRNTLQRFPEELKEIIYLKTSLKRQIIKKERERHG